MWDSPERELDPPEHWTCHECGSHFYLDFPEESEEDGPVLCYECANFEGRAMGYCEHENL